jgi:hypothetical protein
LSAIGSTHDVVDYSNRALGSGVSVAYVRITARILGPRQTVSFVQSTILP